jgi:putative phosphotransacetylase
MRTLARLAYQQEERTMSTEIPIRLSNHHIHPSQEAVLTLFGKEELTFMRYLDGEGDLVAFKETVTIKGPKGSIDGIRVLGPLRGKVQVELLVADCYKLGVDAPVRMSGDLAGAAELTIIGPCGELTLPCGIIAHRHIHIYTEAAAKLHLADGDTVRVKVAGERGLTFDNVKLKVSSKVTAHQMMMHVDTEEGNAAGIANNSFGVLVD